MPAGLSSSGNLTPFFSVFYLNKILTLGITHPCGSFVPIQLFENLPNCLALFHAYLNRALCAER